MKAWITSMNDYNSGRLTGEWVDLDGTLWDSIAAFLERRSKETGELHEEHAIHDYEAPRPIIDWLGEYPSKAQIELLSELSEDEIPMWAAWIDIQGMDVATDLDAARDSYHGTCSSPADFAAELYAEERGALGDLAMYIDWESVARDLGFNGNYTFADYDGETHVFSN